MRKFAFVVLICAILLALCGVVAHGQNTSEGFIEEEIIPSCVAIVTDLGVGTGVVVSAEGYIVTNRHIVDNASVFLVYTSDFRKHKGRVVGLHSTYDIALIKIEPAIPIPSFGLDVPGEEKIITMNRVHIGETVYAVGMPFGLPWVVTKGIVSQKFKLIDGTVYWQIDAAVNPGNSGGPLVDANGLLVGINTSGLPAYVADNIAFALATQIWIEEVQLLIQADKDRLVVITDVNKYLKEDGKPDRWVSGQY